ncbi:STAS-like domain-containing protein [Dyadobacter sp.]|uniref:STAS-like domain-containing protein n=1 Tax=Dyadobacter sp. TaxID=1914288 RepID=UPI003F72996A
MVLEMQKFGSVLGSRRLGVIVREEILNALAANTTVVFDMAGVNTVSNSFADECFGKLLFDVDFDTLKKKTTFSNSIPFVRDTIKIAMNQRMSMSSAIA